MVSFRPTAVQALGRGVYLGCLVGGAGAAVMLALSAGLGDRIGLPAWLAAAAPLALGAAVGGLLGLTLGRYEGADIDHTGIHSVPPRPEAFAPWRRIEDLREERRGGRTHVAIYLDTGAVGRLRAPYDGRLLAADPEFERKLFMLRNLWETHRDYTLHNHPPTPEDA